MGRRETGDGGRETGDGGQAATQGRPYGGIGRNGKSGKTGGDRAQPLRGYRKFLRRADVGIGPYEREGTGRRGRRPLRRGWGRRIAASALWASSQ